MLPGVVPQTCVHTPSASTIACSLQAGAAVLPAFARLSIRVDMVAILTDGRVHNVPATDPPWVEANRAEVTSRTMCPLESMPPLRTGVRFSREGMDLPNPVAKDSGVEVEADTMEEVDRTDLAAVVARATPIIPSLKHSMALGWATAQPGLVMSCLRMRTQP